MILQQEKAKELYDKFHSELPSFSDEGQLEHKLAKQCALIAVDQIISHIEPSISMDVLSARIKFWHEVIQEIEKL